MTPFGTAHRAEGTTYGIAQFAPGGQRRPAAGAPKWTPSARPWPIPERPLIADLWPAARSRTKLTILQSLADKVDGLIVGGGIANTFMLASGLHIGKSLAEGDLVEEAKKVIEAMKARRRPKCRSRWTW